jgi:hypothetical protein
MTILMNVIPNTIIILKFSLLLCLFNLFKLNIIIPINTIYDIRIWHFATSNITFPNSIERNKFIVIKLC